jgi:hypothetical protein
MLEKAETDQKIVGIKVCHAAPSINHLFFADDSLILMRARNEEADELKRILEVYERASGQMINKDKSSILFSPNTKRTVRVQMKATLAISQEKWGEGALGYLFPLGYQRRHLHISNRRFGAECKDGRKRCSRRRGKKL